MTELDTAVTEGHQDVYIGLPLPLDMVGTIVGMIGDKYPGAMIVTDGAKYGSGLMSGGMTIRIPDSDRFFDDGDDFDDFEDDNPVWLSGDEQFDDVSDGGQGARAKTVPKVEKRPLSSKVDDADLTRFDETFGVSLPESITLMMVDLCRGLMEQFPDAPNYVELNAYDKDTGKHWLVTVQNPDGETAHDLRVKAERRADEAIAALRAAFSPEALAFLATHPDPAIANAVNTLVMDAALSGIEPASDIS